MFNRWLAALLGSLLICGGAMAADSWVHYRDPASGASMDFPGQPELSTANGDGRVTSTAGVSTDDAYYSLSVVTYGEVLDGDPWTVLEAGLAGGLNAANATLVSKTRTEIDGSPAMVVDMKRDSDNLKFRSVFTVRDSRLYVAVVVGSPQLPAETDRFLASLHLGGETP
ncbi:hypothetical protein QO010_003170 [Caulobacter ginsengisoli]|uniref:Uncharacterized protein n=1 Tax=Caulobacter ginsengisoli TaxID=400775 RepID=A0ABU0ITP6_9CAUL|nr:hypothetical protein [Caulobacter ginsengisoli]MDQ0465383.1 hypothetical protein [Caulobacter ginsengisoli]